MSDIITHIIPPSRVAKRVRSEKVEARKTACHHRLPTVCPWRKERSNSLLHIILPAIKHNIARTDPPSEVYIIGVKYRSTPIRIDFGQFDNWTRSYCPHLFVDDCFKESTRHVTPRISGIENGQTTLATIKLLTSLLL